MKIENETLKKLVEEWNEYKAHYYLLILSKSKNPEKDKEQIQDFVHHTVNFSNFMQNLALKLKLEPFNFDDYELEK